jgi:hypothetical protein
VLGHDLGGYLAYTLGSSRRSVGRAEGSALFDRRHVLSAALSSRLGRGVRAGVRGSFYTGVPADVAYLAAARNPPRTSPFHRIDLRLEKRWRLNDAGAFWALVLEVRAGSDVLSRFARAGCDSGRRLWLRLWAAAHVYFRGAG